MLLLLACAGPGDDSAPPASTCDSDVGAVSTVATVAGGTEGISFLNGTMYVSQSEAIRSIALDGTVGTLAKVSSALGLAPGVDTLLVAAPGEFTIDGSGTDGSVLRVGVDGSVETLEEGFANPNFLAVSNTGTVLMSDDTNESIWALGQGEWATGIPSPNGMAFSPDFSTLYVVSTFVSDPPLWRIPVEGGAAGTAEVVANLPTGSAPDGITVDADGNIWVAANVAGELVRITPEGEMETIAEDLPNPASLAFGQGDWDPCSIYMTSLYGDTVSRVEVGVTGASLALP